jgi:hypothetical protein
MQETEKPLVCRNVDWLITKFDTSPHAIAEELRRRGYKEPSQPTIHRITTGESRDPKSKTLAPLAEFFGVTVTDLREKDLQQEEKGISGTGTKEEQPIRSVPPVAKAHNPNAIDADFLVQMISLLKQATEEDRQKAFRMLRSAVEVRKSKNAVTDDDSQSRT